MHRRRGHDATVIWVYIVLAIVAIVAIILAIEVIKWLFIIAVAAALVWLLFWIRRRV